MRETKFAQIGAILLIAESIVTPSGNSGHVVAPKACIGKEAVVTLKENKRKK
jgi:putative transposon-encoded protein